MAGEPGAIAIAARRRYRGRQPQGLSVAEAIEAYTLTSAYAGFEEKDRGSLEPGKLADMVLLSRDILADTERDHITETQVVMTMVGGKVAYEKR